MYGLLTLNSDPGGITIPSPVLRYQVRVVLWVLTAGTPRLQVYLRIRVQVFYSDLLFLLTIYLISSQIRLFTNLLAFPDS